MIKGIYNEIYIIPVINNILIYAHNPQYFGVI